MRSSEWKRGGSKNWIDNPQPSGPRQVDSEGKIFILPRQKHRVIVGCTIDCACVQDVRKTLYKTTFFIDFYYLVIVSYLLEYSV